MVVVGPWKKLRQTNLTFNRLKSCFFIDVNLLRPLGRRLQINILLTRIITSTFKKLTLARSFFL